jgi:transposase InsO family protein
VSQFLAAVDNYVLFYNTKRPHAKNKYKTPEAKEQEFYMRGNTF